MTDTTPHHKNSFRLSNPGSNRQPLELYHLSHDLRGPLNSILGFSELLLEGVEGPLTDFQQADIEAIYHSAQNLLRLISNLVDLSKLEAGRLNFDFGPVNLEPVLRHIAAFDFGAAKPEQVELKANIPAQLPPVQGDKDRLEQMVMNLLRFVFKQQKQGPVTLSAQSDAGAITIRVTSGIELSPEQIAGLFELGVHVDPAGRSELTLGGLELPLTRRLAEKHHGRVWAEATPGHGTVFYLNLPVT